MFSRDRSDYNGIPPRLYREPEEIRRDICAIRERISSTDLRLNARYIIAEMICAQSCNEPERWIPALRGIVEEASSTLDELISLRNTLDWLRYELEETKCALTS